MTQTNPALDAQTSWQRLLQRSALALGGALLASALVSWVAANWAALSPVQKLAGAQGLLVLLSLFAWYLTWRGQTLTHRHSATVFSSLAAVGIGALLALIGQQYQTGADAWQLFFWWAVLLLPWLVTLHTVFLTLLWGVVVNVMLGLALLNGAWAVASLTLMLLAALFNAALLGLLEGFGARSQDVWRIGPRMALAALLFWLTLAQVQDASALALVFSLLTLAGGAYAYARQRFDLGMLSLGALYALVWVVTQYVLRINDAFESAPLLGLIFVLLAMATKTLTWFRRLHQQHSRTMTDTTDATDAVTNADTLCASNADRVAVSGIWSVNLFRCAALWLVAWLLVAFLFVLLELSLNTMGVLGVFMAAAGVWALKTQRDQTWRELVVAVIAAGFILACTAVLSSSYRGMDVALAIGFLAFGAIVYTQCQHATLRFFCAFFTAIAVLGLTGDAFWDRVLDSMLDDHALLDDVHAPLLLRLWLLTGAAVACLSFGRDRMGTALVPLAWALAFMAQTLAWTVPAPWNVDSTLAVQLLRTGFALLPATLLWGLWRRSPPDLPAAVRWPALFVLLAAGAGWFGAPGIALSLVWWFLGFHLGRREWMALGGLSLVVYLWQFYYDLDISLLSKAALLAAMGLWFLLGGLALARTVREHSPQSSPRAARHVRIGLPAGLILVLTVVNLDIAHKETILRDGARVVLELTPVDPRSLMQGDYMALAYAVNRQARQMLPRTEPVPSSGSVFVLQADARGVHQLVAVQPHAESRATEHIAMHTRLSAHAPVVGVDSYFFPEGRAAHFAQARYGEYRVSPSGQALLLRLLDANFQPL